MARSRGNGLKILNRRFRARSLEGAAFRVPSLPWHLQAIKMEYASYLERIRQELGRRRESLKIKDLVFHFTYFTAFKNNKLQPKT